MKKFKISQKALNYSLLCGLVCAVFLSFSGFNTACDDLRHNVLRLHIIANSDSNADQTLKLKIRDRILSTSGELFADTDNIEDAVLKTEKALEEIEKTANEVIAENGFNYKCKVSVKNRYFETREYDTFTLPAGTYKALVLDVGKAEGKNWWCVIFPEICLPASSNNASLSDTVSEGSAEIAENKPKYEVRFKIVEIYEDLKKKFS